MTDMTLSEGAARDLEQLRARGMEIFGPGPMTRGQTTPTPDAAEPMPGVHIQVRDGHRLVEGFGATADQAVSDVLGKIAGYDAQGTPIGTKPPIA